MPDNVTNTSEGMENGESGHNHLLHKLMLGTALVTGAVVLAPYVLPALGIGSAGLTLDAIGALHTLGLGTGLAGLINAGLNAIPLIGPTLAQGGIATAAASGTIGIGGTLLGNFLEKKHNGKPGINWGKVIKYAALATSALIALPAILSGISIGLTFLSDVANTLLPASMQIPDLVPTLGKTLGANGALSIAKNSFGGVSGLLPHLLTCGGALFPTVFSAGLASKDVPAASKRRSTPDRQKADDTITASISGNRPTTANVPVSAALYLKDTRTGLPVTYDELAITHTRKLHLYVTDQSLKEYHHIHPHPTGEPGVLAFSFTPRTSNQYNAWADFTLMKDGSNHRVKIEIPSEIRRNIPAVIRANTQAEQDGLVFDWRSSVPLQKDTPAIVEVNVTDKQGNPVTDLEPVMGAFAHLAGFSADGKHFIHTHPLGVEPTSPDDRGGPRLRFHVEPNYAGPTQFVLQICRHGQEVHIPFGQQIKQPELAPERMGAMNHSAMNAGYGM